MTRALIIISLTSLSFQFSCNFQLNQLIKGLDIVELTVTCCASTILTLSLGENRGDYDGEEKSSVHVSTSPVQFLRMRRKRSLPKMTTACYLTLFDGETAQIGSDPGGSVIENPETKVSQEYLHTLFEFVHLVVADKVSFSSKVSGEFYNLR